MNEKIQEKIQENFDIVLEDGVAIFGGLLSNTIIGQIAPGVVTTYLSYRQKRSERMIMSALDEFKNRLNNIETQLRDMTEKEMNFIKNKALPIMFDFIINEQQGEKVKFIVNGMENIITYRITDEDLILTYFDVLNELRIIDIKELLEINNSNSRGQVSVTSTQINKIEAVKKHIFKKLQKYDLITINTTWGEMGGKEYTIDKKRTIINVFGANFINFITKRNIKL